MKSKKPSRKQMPALCAEVDPDDGLDPKAYFRSTKAHTNRNRKAHQLCSQVADTLNLVLGECGDEILRNLQVVAVTPAPDSSQLLVLVAPAIEGEPANPGEVLARLSAAAGRLRGEVAAAITRRRAPKLSFQFVAGQILPEVRP
jgi:ribosome-binding factor A